METGSLVEYIGGQCRWGREIAPLYEDRYYTISHVGIHSFPQRCNMTGRIVGYVNSKYVEIEEEGNVQFMAKMFREVQAPIDLTELMEDKQILTVSKF